MSELLLMLYYTGESYFRFASIVSWTKKPSAQIKWWDALDYNVEQLCLSFGVWEKFILTIEGTLKAI